MYSNREHRAFKHAEQAIPVRSFMNGYAKRFFALKSSSSAFSDDFLPLKGVAAVEPIGGETIIDVSVYNLNLLAADRICAVIYLGEFYFFDLSAKKRVTVKIDKTADLSGKTLILLMLPDLTPLCRAAADGGESLIKEGELYAKKIIDSQSENNRKEQANNEFFTEKGSGKYAYDDFRIATENYYRLDDAKIIYAKNERAQNSDCEEAQKSENDCDFKFDEKYFDRYKSENYYLSVKQKIDSLLNENPAEESLNDRVTGGKFAAISYDKSRRYLVGVVKENGNVKYVCYGIPVNRKDPAPRLKGAKFIPADPFDLYGRGYYVVFKNASDGQTV